MLAADAAAGSRTGSAEIPQIGAALVGTLFEGRQAAFDALGFRPLRLLGRVAWASFYGTTGQSIVSLQRRPDGRYRIYVASPDGNAGYDFTPQPDSSGAFTLPVHFIWSSGSGSVLGSTLLCFGNECQLRTYSPLKAAPLIVGRVLGFNGSDNNSFHWTLGRR